MSRTDTANCYYRSGDVWALLSDPKTIVTWQKCSITKDADMGQKHPRSTVLTLEEGAIIVAFRKHTLLPLDDCLYALQTSIPHLIRSSLHRRLQSHIISRLPDVDGEVKPKKDIQTISYRLFSY
jgi:hypothetical protein